MHDGPAETCNRNGGRKVPDPLTPDRRAAICGTLRMLADSAYRARFFAIWGHLVDAAKLIEQQEEQHEEEAKPEILA